MDADESQIAKLTMSTQLAQERYREQHKEAAEQVPKRYHGYLDVFTDYLDKKLPPR